MKPASAAGVLIVTMLLATGLTWQLPPKLAVAETDILQARDETVGWSLPYIAPEPKQKAVASAIKDLKPGMHVVDAVAKLGVPDAVDDLHGPFRGLSRADDNFFMQRRGDLSFRLLWYLSKHGRGANLNDRWIAGYVGPDSGVIVRFITNKLDQ